MPVYAFSGSLTRPAPQYAQANGKGIVTYSWDEDDGRLTAVAAMSGIDDTAYVLADPDHKALYATCEVQGADQSSLASFAVDPDTGKLSSLGRQKTDGGEACHLSLATTGAHLLVSNYNGVVTAGAPSQSVTVFPLSASGNIDAAADTVRIEGEGPNRDRQTSAHAHCAITSPDGRFVHVADLGIDAIATFARNADGTLGTRTDTRLPPGLGPRHIVFHPDGKVLFLVSELIPTVISFAYTPETGIMTQQDDFPIPSEDGGIVQPAGIVISADGRFVYVSLRECNEILCLAADEGTGKLSAIARIPSGGKTPRDLTLTPSNRHLIVTNQDSDTISVFARNPDTGELNGPTQQVDAGTPMTITIADFPSA